ncbi:MAG: FkbM family methyltransferase [Bacteroidetes bacterium]|nr:MAG: FkbM family methyltransferase [Bacteroidota bacterium]
MITERTSLHSRQLEKQFGFCHAAADFLFNKFRFPGSRKLSRLISGLVLPPLKEQVLCPTIYGFDIVLNAEKNFEIHEIYYLGFYEAGTLDVLKQCLSPNDVFLDVGASVGLMSLYAAKMMGSLGKVFAFEPTRKSYDVFSESISHNRFSNISAFKMGLGNETRSIPIYTDRGCPSMVELNSSDPREMVEIDRLDSVLAKEGVSKVRMMKIDVEGFELEVLRGAEKLLTGKDAPIICIEYMKALIKPGEEDAVGYLEKINKYRFYQLRKSKNTISKLFEVEKGGKFRNDDNIFCLLDSHLGTLPKSLFVK